MKPSVALIYTGSAAAIGLLSGWLLRPVHDPRPTAEFGPAAITFTGDARIRSAALLTDTPPGAKRSRSESLALLQEANRRNDAVMRDTILAEWARHETATGIRSVFSSESDLEAWQLLHAWAKHQPSEAVRIATASAGVPTEAFWHDLVITQSLISLLLTDPAAAQALERDFYRRGAQKLEEHLDKDELPTGSVADTLGALSGFRDPSLRDRLVRHLVSADRIDPAKALDWAATRRDLENRQHFTNAILYHFLENDPDKAGAYVAEHFDGSDHSRLLVREYLEGMAQRSPAKMLEWMHRQNRELLTKVAPLKFYGLPPEEMETLATLLAEEFPEFAPDPTTGPMMMPAAMADLPEVWPPTTKAGAVAWLKGYNQSWGAHLGPEAWTAESMTRVLELLDDLPNHSRAGTLREMASAWARVDPQEAITWAAGLPDQESVEIATFALASWMRESPGDARAYVAAIPESEFRAYAVEQTVRELCSKHPDTAEQWLRELPSDQARDAGLRELANDFLVYRGTPQIDGVRYERAVRLFQQVANPLIRADGLESSLRKLSTLEPPRALELIAESGLPTAITTELETLARSVLEHRRKTEQNRKTEQAR